MKKNIFYLLPFVAFAIGSCSNKTTKQEKMVEINDTTEDAGVDTSKGYGGESDTVKGMENGGIRLTPLTGSTEFPDAVLEMNAPKQNAKLKPGPVTFSYEVKNFTLGNQTNKPCTYCSNSDKGQHIHLILNNQPYIAKYEPSFTDTLKAGHYVALSFISRSYHESIKQFDAFDLRQFTVGKTDKKDIDLTKPLLFYSRPKGEYVGNDTKQVLLDFYLVNVDLSPEGYKVKATINGNDFTLDKWQPYVIEGMPMGENIIKLELMDKEGKKVTGPFTEIERKITLTEKKSS